MKFDKIVIFKYFINRNLEKFKKFKKFKKTGNSKNFEHPSEWSEDKF